jgi:hypothetical protein
MRIAAQKEIAGMQIGAKTKSDKENLLAKQQLEGMRLGHQIGIGKEQINQQRQSQKLKIMADLAKQQEANKKNPSKKEPE